MSRWMGTVKGLWAVRRYTGQKEMSTGGQQTTQYCGHTAVRVGFPEDCRMLTLVAET